MSWTWINRAVKGSERNPNMAFCKTWNELTRIEMNEVHFLSFDLSIALDSDNIIRIHHVCEDGIEKSVPRITDWHREACRVMTNGDPEGRVFDEKRWSRGTDFFYPTFTRLLDSFSCSPLNTAFPCLKWHPEVPEYAEMWHDMMTSI